MAGSFRPDPVQVFLKGINRMGGPGSGGARTCTPECTCQRHSQKTEEERFWEKVERHVSGCWLWTAALSHDGYAKFKAKGFYYAHRWSYTRFIGPIPPRLDLDHLCRVRHCVNPEHLEAVTHRENLSRGTSWTYRKQAQA